MISSVNNYSDPRSAASHRGKGSHAEAPTPAFTQRSPPQDITQHAAKHGFQLLNTIVLTGFVNPSKVMEFLDTKLNEKKFMAVKANTDLNWRWCKREDFLDAVANHCLLQGFSEPFQENLNDLAKMLKNSGVEQGLPIRDSGRIWHDDYGFFFSSRIAHTPGTVCTS